MSGAICTFLVSWLVPTIYDYERDALDLMNQIIDVTGRSEFALDHLAVYDVRPCATAWWIYIVIRCDGSAPRKLSPISFVGHPSHARQSVYTEHDNRVYLHLPPHVQAPEHFSHGVTSDSARHCISR